MMTMSKFFHRTNDNSTVDSICTGCFATIAVARSHEDLLEAEASHACTPLTHHNHLEPSKVTDRRRG
jgi:hypothetical protein